MSTNTTVKNVEASRRHTRGQYPGSFLVCAFQVFVNVFLCVVGYLDIVSDAVIFVT